MRASLSLLLLVPARVTVDTRTEASSTDLELAHRLLQLPRNGRATRSVYFYQHDGNRQGKIVGSIDTVTSAATTAQASARRRFCHPSPANSKRRPAASGNGPQGHEILRPCRVNAANDQLSPAGRRRQSFFFVGEFSAWNPGGAGASQAERWLRRQRTRILLDVPKLKREGCRQPHVVHIRRRPLSGLRQQRQGWLSGLHDVYLSRTGRRRKAIDVAKMKSAQRRRGADPEPRRSDGGVRVATAPAARRRDV